MSQEEPTLIKQFIKLSAGPSPIVLDNEDGARQIEVVSVPASLSAVGVAGQKFYHEDDIKEWEQDCPTCKQKFPNLDDMLDHDVAVHRTKEATDPKVKWVTKGGKRIPITQGQGKQPAPQQKPVANKPISVAPENLMKGDKPIELKPEPLVPVDFDTASKNFTNFILTVKSQDYSFDPQTGKAFDAQNKNEAQAFHQKFSDGFNDVFVISTTNHQGQLSRESESAYEQVKNEKRYPLIGHWVSHNTGFDYTDISFPIDHGTTEEEALAMAKDHAQESIVAVTRRGTARVINVT